MTCRTVALANIRAQPFVIVINTHRALEVSWPIAEHAPEITELAVVSKFTIVNINVRVRRRLVGVFCSGIRATD